MSLAILHSRAQLGIESPLVTVEVHLSNGLPAFAIVGLPETAVKESRDRVRSALINSRFEFPVRKITVNLAPADLPKEGGRYDLPIALGILAASGQLERSELNRYEYMGELALSGELRAVKGMLPAIIAASRSQRAVFIASANGAEAALAQAAEIYAADHLLQVTATLGGKGELAPIAARFPKPRSNCLDLADVRGQEFAKRALEISAAGGHSLLLIGPPGAGKTMLATRLPGLLPDMSESQALETASLQSLAGSPLDLDTWSIPPFRSPHHSSSSAALVGGGSHPRPGEISLAHNGILFLDELPEFSRGVLEHLREPLESKVIHIARAARQVSYPACFQLVAAMNPCPCGWLGDPRGRCRCTADQVQKYRCKISGPLLDRIDMHVEVPPVPKQFLRDGKRGEIPSSEIRRRVIRARDIQQVRGGCLNHQLHGEGLNRACRLTGDAQALLDTAMDKLGLSARAYHRILKVARTIADLAGTDNLSARHIGEAIGYRVLDRLQ